MTTVDYGAGSERTAFPMAKHQGSRYEAPPAETRDGEVTGRAVQTILVEPQALYDFWRDVTTIPRWQEYVIEVLPKTDRVSHWVMGNPDDEKAKRLEFDSEIIDDIPGKKIAWQSITEGVDLSGTVTFEASPSGRGTLVTLVQHIKVPGGLFGNALAGLAKRSPRQIVTEDLRHFKQITETGEIPSVKGQPHGPRGMVGAIKEWMYGENNPTPPGTSDLA